MTKSKKKLLKDLANSTDDQLEVKNPMDELSDEELEGIAGGAMACQCRCSGNGYTCGGGGGGGDE